MEIEATTTINGTAPAVCPGCGGDGNSVSSQPGHPCYTCNGDGEVEVDLIEHDREVTVNVEPFKGDYP